MPYYIVRDELDKEGDRIVIAPSQAQAVRHVAKRYTARPGGTAEIAEMIIKGAKPETAGQEPDPTP